MNSGRHQPGSTSQIEERRVTPPGDNVVGPKGRWADGSRSSNRPAMSDVASPCRGVYRYGVELLQPAGQSLRRACGRRVEAAVDELGFVPSGLARALARGHHPVVGLVVLDLNNPYFSVAARGMEDRLAPKRASCSPSRAATRTRTGRGTASGCSRSTRWPAVVITHTSPSLRFLERRDGPAVRRPCCWAGGPRPTGGWCAVTGDDALGGALVGSPPAGARAPADRVHERDRHDAAAECAP